MTSSSEGRSGTSYLVRFDDLCPTMNWRIWDRIEKALVTFDIHPIVGVIPSNEDESLFFDPPNPNFWERVRQWQELGWTVALHGYQHRYLTAERGLYGWDRRSEFAGLPFEEQRRKLQAALEVLDQEQVRADAWMAPNHSFDEVTLLALADVGLTTITDGLGRFPYRDEAGILWLPVQLWAFRRRQAGVWTVCLHPNRWRDEDAASFIADLERYSERITSVPDVVAAYASRRRAWTDIGFAAQRRVRKAIATAARNAPTGRVGKQ